MSVISRVGAVAAIATLLALGAGCDGGGGDTTCADSAFHVLACTGTAATASASSCDPTAARAVMKEDCDGVNAAVSDGKQDGAWSDARGFLCVHLGIPEYCD